MENLCQCVSVTLGQRSSNGQKYAMVWPIYDFIHNSAIRCR